MLKATIFDWIGTLYERGKGPFQDSLETLKKLKALKIKIGLISLGKDEMTRKLEISSSGLESYFDYVFVRPNKDAIQYLSCMYFMGSDNRTTLIVDDRTLRGIKIGNSLNCPTAWIKRGEYAHELPNDETGQPTYTISTVSAILPLFNFQRLSD